ncbi:MAG: YbhB/YbcL family Raf kinase inhibitor-like protein [Candidatus Woesebacteria bacterium]|jgi:Raf kinase inhibitor-like YbhB/YbcL family protein
MPLTLTSPAFIHNGQIPPKYSCKGENISPPLEISGIPEGTLSLALIVDDPDAPAGDWVHWLLWNIPQVAKIEENTTPKAAVAGVNSFFKTDYGGPCPPSGTHRYFFKLFALDTVLDLDNEAEKADLKKAMEGHVLESTELVGLFSKEEAQ